MRLLMEQAKIKNKKDKDYKSENTKKNSLPIIITSEKGEKEYVHHWLQGALNSGYKG